MPVLGITKIVGKNIRFLRESKNITQEELAFRCGLHRTYVGSVERGERNVTIKTLEKFAQELDVPISELLDSKK